MSRIPQGEQYTADAICRAMGLAGFVEPDWSPPVLRLLLKPSFHAEVCVTLYGPAEEARLSVIALAEPLAATAYAERLWGRQAPDPLATWSEQAEVDASAFTRAAGDFAEALAEERAVRKRGVCLDGMPVECCLLTADGLERFACQMLLPEVATLVTRLLRLAWEACSGVEVRNGLADCAGYIGEKYPRETRPPAPEVTRLLVLGTPEARADLLRQWREHGGSV